MNITIDEIMNRYIVNQVITVKIKVVYPGIGIVETPFKAFQSLRLLEELHYGIEVQIVARQTEILIRPFLGPHCTPSCYQECEDRCDY
jgi:hypothetical protein